MNPEGRNPLVLATKGSNPGAPSDVPPTLATKDSNPGVASDAIHGLVWPGLAWSGLVWPDLAWSGLVWPGGEFANVTS